MKKVSRWYSCYAWRMIDHSQSLVASQSLAPTIGFPSTRSSMASPPTTRATSRPRRVNSA